MRLPVLTFLVAVIVIAECNHTFVGTNVQRPLLQKQTVKYSSRLLQKRVETYYYSTPHLLGTHRRGIIQGILAYDLTNTGASANITSGGIGYPYVGLRMKSDRGKKIHYDIYIYS